MSRKSDSNEIYIFFGIHSMQNSQQLAKVVIHVQDSSSSALPNYLVRLYNSPAGAQWGADWMSTAGDATRKL